jgi:hypothetical protein
VLGVGYGGAMGIRETNRSPFTRYINDFHLIHPAPYGTITLFEILVNHNVVPHKIMVIKTRAIISPIR